MAILEQCRNRQLSHNLLDIARRFRGDDVDDDDAQGSDESSEEEDDDESDDDEGDDLSVDSLPEEIQGAHQPHLYIGVHNLHDAIVGHDTFHIAPLDNVEQTLGNGECDCMLFGNYFVAGCCRNWGPNDPIDWNEIYETSLNSANDPHRLPNNSMRKHYYRCIYRLCDLGGTERWARIELPVCAVAKIRQMYPSADGNYMGFLPE